MKKATPFLLIILCFFILNCNSEPPLIYKNKLSNTVSKNLEALDFCKENNYNTQYCFMVDLGTHSGLNRFYVWDLKNNRALDSGLVAHGSCKQLWKDRLSKDNISNVNNSHCSSIGKYEIGERAYSNWGIHIKYWIKGLEETNNNAVSRVVVLHSWEKIDDEEIYPNTSVESWGCPAVSDKYMKRLDERLKKTEKPVLLWIYLD